MSILDRQRGRQSSRAPDHEPDEDAPAHAPDPPKAATKQPEPASTPEGEPRPPRKGRVAVRALRTCLIDAMAHMEGQTLTVAEEDLDRLVKRGDIERI